MSKLSRFFIAVMVCGLAFMAGLRAWQAYERRAAQEAEETPSASTFNSVPVRYEPQPPAVPVPRRLPSPSDPPQEILLGDAPLTADAARLQAQQTVASILSDYKDNPALQAFYADLQEATGREIDLAVLSSDRMADLVRQYPQVPQIMDKHTQNPEFAQVMQEILRNPQFARSVAVLQGGETSVGGR